MSGRRTRKIDFHEPGLTAAGATGKTGLDFMFALVEAKVPAPPIFATLGCQLVSVADGVARIELVPGEHLYGWSNAVHSGLAATLLEAVMNAAVTTVLDATTLATTASLTTNITRAITGRVGKVVAEGWVVHRGTRAVTVEGRLSGEEGRLFAHGSATCVLGERHEGA